MCKKKEHVTEKCKYSEFKDNENEREKYLQSTEMYIRGI